MPPGSDAERDRGTRVLAHGLFFAGGGLGAPAATGGGRRRGTGIAGGAVTECAEPSPGGSSLGSWAASVSGLTPLSPPPKPRWDGGAQKGAQKEMSPLTEIH